MKKYNEGYALPFVLVVMIVLSIIAVSVMDFSLRNLQSESKTVQKMIFKLHQECDTPETKNI